MIVCKTENLESRASDAMRQRFGHDHLVVGKLAGGKITHDAALKIPDRQVGSL